MRLSDNFWLVEFTKSQVAERRAISNTPSAIEVDSMKLLCVNVLEPVRRRFGTTIINSGYRSPMLNAAIGGARTSQHVSGEAADIECPGTPNILVAQFIRDRLTFDQLILEHYHLGVPASGWIHVSWVDHRDLRNEVLTKQSGLPYTVGLP